MSNSENSGELALQTVLTPAERSAKVALGVVIALLLAVFAFNMRGAVAWNLQAILSVVSLVGIVAGGFGWRMLDRAATRRARQQR